MAITASMVKELREATGAGMMDAKKALTETDGDFEAAVDWLRTKGLAKAAKKSGRVAAEGLVAVAIDGTTGVAVEVNSETDFVAKNAEFQEMVSSLRLQAFLLRLWRILRRLLSLVALCLMCLPQKSPQLVKTCHCVEWGRSRVDQLNPMCTTQRPRAWVKLGFLLL